MVIRHFRKQVQRPSGSESSSSDEEAATEKPTDLTAVTTTLAEGSDGHSPSKETSNSDIDSSSSSSSSSSDEVTLHKPVFLKRKRVNHPQQQEEKNGSLIRAAHLTKVLQEKQTAQRALDSETADQSILTQVISIDDTDSVNPELELQLWEQRQQARLTRERKKKLQKQLRIEEQEMQRAAQLDIKDDPLLKQPESEIASNRLDALRKKNASRNMAQFHTSKTRTDSAVPTRLDKNGTKLASLHTSNSTEDTEYAYVEE